MSGTVVGLDIGTCFIRLVVGEVKPDDSVEIIGLAKRPSKGLRNGVIVNIDAAMNVIKETIEEAEQNAGVEITDVYTAIGGNQIESFNQTGQIGVDQSGRNRPVEINENARRRCIEAAQAVMIPIDKKLIHVLPQDYIIDGQPGIKDPIGMMAVRLVTNVHIVTASLTSYANIEKCILRAHYNLNLVMLKTLAATYAVVNEDEKNLGSILIDMGGGTTDIIVINNDAPVFTGSVPVGGNLVTNDIALLKGIPDAEAERIKIESGCCWLFGGEENQEVIIPGIGGRPPEMSSRRELFDIIEPRVEEIFKMVKQEVVRKANLTELNGSIILTGGGALMPGVTELAQSVFKTSSVRVGCGAALGGADDSYRDPDYATALGLVIFNAKDAGKDYKGVKSRRQADESNGKSKSRKFVEFLKKFM